MTTTFSSSKYFWCARDRLGYGRTSCVFAGYKRDNCSKVAVKMYQSSFYPNTFEREKRAMEAIGSHENIVKLIEIDEEKQSKAKVIVMELSTEGSLQDILDLPENGFGLCEADFITVISDVSSGLAHLRELNIAHLDIKPRNILKFHKPDGKHVFKLGDFGTSRELDEDEALKSLCGTAEYQHPAIHKSGSATAKVDLWSVGVTFFYVATGREPFLCDDKEHMRDIILKKESGVIYGWQLGADKVPQYGKALPSDIRISRHLRVLIEPVLASLMEGNILKMIGFDEFFDRIQAIVQKKVVDVFCVYSCSIHKIYIDPDEPNGIQALKGTIHRLVGIDPSLQELYYDGQPFSPRECIPASKLPDTTTDSPFVVLGGPTLKKADLENLIIATIPAVPRGYAMARDIQYGKECCKLIWALKSAAENLSKQHKLMHHATRCIRHSVHNDYQLLEGMLHSVEQINHSTCKLLSGHIVGLNSQTQLVATLMPTANNLLDFLRQETASQESMLHKVRDALLPLKHKTNNLKVEVSAVGDVDLPLSHKVFCRCVGTLQYMVQCMDSSCANMKRRIQSKDTLELDAHELIKSGMHQTLHEAHEKVTYLNSEREKDYQRLGEWMMKCIGVQSKIRENVKTLSVHLDGCNKHLFELEQWEKNFPGRLGEVLDGRSLPASRARGDTNLPLRKPVQDDPALCCLVMNELQRASGECSRTVELQKALLAIVSDLTKSEGAAPS